MNTQDFFEDSDLVIHGQYAQVCLKCRAIVRGWDVENHAQFHLDRGDYDRIERLALEAGSHEGS